MNAISAYLAQRHFQSGGDDRRNGADQRQPNQYGPNNALDEHWPRDNGMERGGDSGRRMNNEVNGPESRYRGRDGRWKAGTRRSEYDGGAAYNDQTSRRMGDDDDMDDDVQSNVIPWTGSPHMPPQNRSIGFGANPMRYETRSHYEGGKAEAEVGGTMWMKPVEREHDQESAFDKNTMEKWVHHMEDDKGKPIQKWSAEEIKPIASRFGYPTFGEKFDDFYTAMHMMKSDYCSVAEDFDVNTPAFYAALADAWLKDPDAEVKGREKLEAYYKHIVKGK